VVGRFSAHDCSSQENDVKTPLADLTSLALFAQVVQSRSFSAAARQAGLAKSAVSKRISLLEERLGVRLLTRTTRKLSLTGEGLRFYEHCAALIAAADAAEESVSAASQTARGRLRVNAPVTFSQLYLGPPIAAFLERYPEIDLELSTENRLVDVVEDAYDVVIRISRLREDSLVARRLAEDRLVVCAAPSYLQRRGEPRRPDDLVGHNCLHYTLVPRAGEWRFRGEGGPLAVPTTGNFSTSDGSLLREAALAGLGIAVLPFSMVADELRAGGLLPVLADHRRGRVGIYAVFASRKQLALRTRLFIDHLVRHFAEPPWALPGRPT
jgi:DNA-binding transcriptional LysR family regulator